MEEYTVVCLCTQPNQSCTSPVCKNMEKSKKEFNGDFRDYFKLDRHDE